MRPLLLLAVLAGGLAAASQPPDPKEIVRRSVQAIEADWSRAPGYSFEERDVESKHYGPFTVKTYQALMIEGSPYKRLIAIGDRQLSASEQALEEQNLRAEIDRRQRESDSERRRQL